MKLPVEESEFLPCDILDIVRRIRADNPAAASRFGEDDAVNPKGIASSSPGLRGTSYPGNAV